MTSLSGEDRFVYIRSAFFVRIKWFTRNACIFKSYYTGPQTPPHHFSKLNFISKILNFALQISAYQEGTKINTEVNERSLKNIGTHWNIRHCWFQWVPISFSLAADLSGSIVWISLNTQIWCESVSYLVHIVHLARIYFFGPLWKYSVITGSRAKGRGGTGPQLGSWVAMHFGPPTLTAVDCNQA